MREARAHYPDKFMHALTPSAIAEPSLRERKLQRTRQTIIDEASKLFRKHGYSTTTLKDIAEAAETSVATIMRYFGSKDAILLHREHVVLGEITAHVRAREAQRVHLLQREQSVHSHAAKAAVVVLLFQVLLHHLQQRAKMAVNHLASIEQLRQLVAIQ